MSLMVTDDSTSFGVNEFNTADTQKIIFKQNSQTLISNELFY